MSTQRPTLGVHLMPTAPIGEMVDLAVFAEQRGATRCWVNDEGLNTRDPYVTLTAIAGATQSIALGPGIANPYSRHPGVTLAAVASLDEWSQGRAFLGLGAGGSMALGPLAIDRHQPRRTLEEMILTTRKLLSGSVVDHDGSVFSYRNAHLSHGRADLPIFVAGRGVRVTELAGRLADGFNLGYVHKAFLERHVAMLRGLAGTRPFIVTYTTMLVTSDSELEAARAALSFRLVDTPADVRAAVGISDERIAEIRAALGAGGPAAAAGLVESDWVDQFMIVGSEPECAAELAQLIDRCGIDEFQLPIANPATDAERIDRLAGWLAIPEGPS